MTKTQSERLKNAPPPLAEESAAGGEAAGAVARALTCKQVLNFLIFGATKPADISEEDFDRHCRGCANCNLKRVKIDVVGRALSVQETLPSAVAGPPGLQTEGCGQCGQRFDLL